MENKETDGQLKNDDYFRMQMKQLGRPIQQCQHCYCSNIIVNNREHLVCCMCGHRTLKNPITY